MLGSFYYVAWQIVRSGAHLLATPRSDPKDPSMSSDDAN